VIQASSIKRLALPVLLVAIWPATAAVAGARHFGYVYEAVTSAPGSVDVENWITWSRTSNPQRADEVDFRHEFEFGITDKFQASVYVADWFYAADPEHSGFTYLDSAVELIYNLTNPVVDPLGLAVYEEIRGGDRIFELESKVIAQKDLGPLILAYNATLEAVWQGAGLQDRQGEFQQALGASYEISQRVSIGVEMLHEFVFPEWRDSEHIRNVFIGPNVSFRHENWFVTVTALAQVTDTPDEADFQLRTIFGIGF
jgi:hypothetical protein